MKTKGETLMRFETRETTEEQRRTINEFKVNIGFLIDKLDDIVPNSIKPEVARYKANAEKAYQEALYWSSMAITE